MNTQIAGPYCPINSYLRGGPWISSEQTDIAKRFKVEIAKLRGEIHDDYELTDRDHHAAFIGGFK